MNNPPPVTEKVPELWFTDADVVLQAGAKLFRVHRSILSARSTIFGDMFAIPHPGRGKGVNVVTKDDSYTYICLPDDAIDVHRFFLAIFDASYFESPPSVHPTAVTISILHLAEKYDVIFLKRRAVAHLNVLLPTKWDDMWKLVNTGYNLGFFTLLELAVAIDIPWVLPAVNFLLMPASLDSILALSPWKSFAPLIQQKYIIDRENCISKMALHSGWIWRPLPPASCLSVAICTLAQGLIRDLGIWRLLRTLPEIFCEECVKAINAECYASGEQFWDHLPEIIDLGSWEALVDAKDSYSN
ncbi:hypothetical protein HYPSUDRAFT_84257 [Hypholoma sublateritium FD-334 SS-4]|uniref:BTB domain-containing protein n=1 Tax=Hypholoma sublateritium (strain FD-334 SS-4) TaxID=945553 RepID=A0A0D2MS83_HYPSF|nr:hypothetical protein HYPSUDRAFT_84257 [Hypholoma sublateritium FD-334 SS-4]